MELVFNFGLYSYDLVYFLRVDFKCNGCECIFLLIGDDFVEIFY